MLKSILAPVDDSEDSKKAARLACEPLRRWAAGVWAISRG